MRHRRFRAWARTCLTALAGFATFAQAADRTVDYQRDVRPILSDYCYTCHGPDEAQRQTEWRLDVKDVALGEIDSGGPAIVPGKSDQSELYRRLSAEDEDERMPPAESIKRPTPEDIALVKQWIDQGAPWKEHWAFLKPQRPDPPEVDGESFVRNPIDRFVLARLNAEGLRPSPPATKETLIRRVTLDLTGLPPTIQEVEAFLADSSLDAYERLVDRLLASPRHGEHMARYWLDAARYGDTHGLHLDNERSMWPYRDWVIRAFNQNKPFDRFTIEQLAGDLLPQPTTDQLVASGFNRAHVTTSEGGAIPEEFQVRYAVDRTETMGSVWMGLTVGCAVCHDHKFDPISQKEFYQLYAYFNNTAENPMDGNKPYDAAVDLKLPSPQQSRQLETCQAELTDVERRIQEELAKVEYVDPAAAEEADTGKVKPQEYVWIEDALPPGAKPSGDTPWLFVAGPDHPVLSEAKSHTRTAPGRSQHFFTEAKPGLKTGEGDRLFAYVYLDPDNPPKEIMLQFNNGSWEHRAFWGDDVIDWGQPGTASRLLMGPMPALGEWVRLEVAAGEVGLEPGAVINGWAFTQFGGAVHWDKAGIVTRTPQGDQPLESLRLWAQVERTAPGSDLFEPVKKAIQIAPQERSEDQKKLIRDHFLEHVYPATRSTFEPLHQRKAEMEKKRQELEAAIPWALVSREREERRPAHLLIRGDYEKKGDVVRRDVPAVLPPLPEGASDNRVGLAQWLVDPSHPLTARVAVNRFWQQYFGAGIVKTVGNFGSQGEWPSHPGLLDWLATEFVESGWDVRRVQRLIVTSGTYRQASRVTPELAERDPENRLFARGPRFRMDAETVRDNALAVSGLLVHRLGGPSVKPYQPPGLWKAVGYTTSDTAVFEQDHGDALYRRSLYTFWKRTSPPPTMLLMDAPTRETCTVRRPRTNTPLAALALMNDTQFFEAARKLAERAMLHGGDRPADRAGFAFRLATARRPSDAELRVLLTQFEEHMAHFREDRAAAEKIVGTGESKRDASLDSSELAAWTIVANLILNLDETITKG